MDTVIFFMNFKMSGAILVRNTPGQSSFDPVKRVMGSLSVTLSVLAVCRFESRISQVESEIND